MPAGQEDACLGNNATAKAGTTLAFNQTLAGKQMAYGQYKEIGFNHNSLSGYPTPIKLPPIFPAADIDLNNEGTSELYLIKKLPSGTYERTYFRHIYIQDPSAATNTAACDPNSDDKE